MMTVVERSGWTLHHQTLHPHYRRILHHVHVLHNLCLLQEFPLLEVIDVHPGHPARPWHGPALARLVSCWAWPGTMTHQAVPGQPTGCSGGPSTGTQDNSMPVSPHSPALPAHTGDPQPVPLIDASSMEAAPQQAGEATAPASRDTIPPSAAPG
jgi:hypothetical protein